MTEGVVTQLDELIALKRLAKRIHCKADGRTVPTGHHLSRLRGRGMDFAEVRNYQAGDEIRHMEWRVTARTGRPHIKVYQEERERPVVILGDFNPSMHFGTRIAFKSVVAARLAALIAWTAVRQGDRVGALLYSEVRHNEFIPKAREQGVLPLLASLCDYTKRSYNGDVKATPITMSDELLRLRRVVKPGSVLVLISDFYQMNLDGIKHLTRLCAHNDVLAYHVSDVMELAPPPPGRYAITNGNGATLLDTGRRRLREDYQAWCNERHRTLQSQFKRLQIKYHPINAGDDLAQVVRQTFPGRCYG